MSEIIQLLDSVLVLSIAGALFLGVLIWMLYILKKQKNNGAYLDTIKWVFLEIRIDELNEKSPLAMEQVFAALHAIHQNFTWGETLNGKSVLSFACEIVSLGGKVSFIIRIPERFRNLLESALFAQYPKAEIAEVEDYLKNLPHHYDPEHVDFDFWGTQWNKKKDNAYPIRTYFQDASFEHSAQETFIDPLSNLLEVMSNMRPHELLVWQLVCKPVNDDWKKHTAHLLDKLKGVPSKHSESLFDIVMFGPFRLLGDALVAFISPPDPHAKPAKPAKEEAPSQMQHKSDVEKMIITAIEHAVSKVSYNVKVRGFYLAPKDKFSGTRKAEIVGAVRNFDDSNLNGLKPDVGHTWTDHTYKISERLEKPYVQSKILEKKRHMLHNFTGRSNWRGTGETIMNTEELATIFHFPQTQHTRVSQMERVHTVKSAPPMDLPIG